MFALIAALAVAAVPAFAAEEKVSSRARRVADRAFLPSIIR